MHAGRWEVMDINDRLRAVMDINDRLRAMLKKQPGVRHEVTQCSESGAWYHHRSNAKTGQWKLEFTCPDCGRKGKFLRNYLGQRVVMCDGIRFIKQGRECTPGGQR